MRQRFRRKPDQAVTAVRLSLDFEGFGYTKWGDLQHAKAGDWLVDYGDGSFGVVSDAIFATTYEIVG